MKNLINFFFSFDKMMKHRLVPAFYWAALLYLGIMFSRNFLDRILFDWMDWLIDTIWFLEFLALIIISFVGLRLICELAIAVFRINDNLSPDGGASEMADIDPLAETRKAAEGAAKRARVISTLALDKTKAAASNIKDSFDKSDGDDVEVSADDVFDEPIKKPEAKKPAPKKTVAKKATPKTNETKKPPAKKTTTKKTTTKKTTAKKTTPKPKK
ncbi:MAG: DUF4282 domain-containing protein [Hellea sp.]|nr:DUF4282 domain-containing protein [Hellea sp.]